MSVVPREHDGSWVADLVHQTGQVAVPAYGSGSSLLIAVLAAEQRYLVEQVGRGSLRGDTYSAKAAERIRRGPNVGH